MTRAECRPMCAARIACGLRRHRGRTSPAASGSPRSRRAHPWGAHFAEAVDARSVGAIQVDELAQLVVHLWAQLSRGKLNPVSLKQDREVADHGVLGARSEHLSAHTTAELVTAPHRLHDG